MSLSPQWLDELRARVTLSGVVQRTTKLTKAGREFRACCPFHNEKTPSFYVNDEKGFYHCFGCGVHGDVIRWMTDQRGLSFMDAVKELAAQAGMEVPAPDPRAAKAAEQRDSLHDVTTAAQKWFVESLASAEGEKARAYLATRGFDAHTIARFGFGYAPEGRQALKAALGQFGEDKLIEAGLRIAIDDPGSSTKKDPYDRFRGRLMLPIEDARGRVIAFGGRILDKTKTDAPKYLNSPETPLFDKGRTLYNLHRASPASRQSGRIIVAEGYMDVIALSAAGFPESVAPLGTALTEKQIEMLWRMVEVPILCFDGDAAGQRAAMRAIARALPLLRPAHSLRIVRLPAGLDPDDLIRRDGPRAMEALLGEAKSLIETLWEHEREAAPLATPEDKAGLKARLLAHVDTIADNDIKSLYRRELLERFSAFAFPARAAPERSGAGSGQGGNWRGNGGNGGGWGGGRSGGRGQGFRPQPPLPSPENMDRLRRHTGGGARDGLCAAVIAGLLCWPGEIARHADALTRLTALDSRFAALLDHFDAGEPLESEDLHTILARQGLTAPETADYGDFRFGFLNVQAEPDQASQELAQAIDLLVERPALEMALKEATARYEQEFTDEAFAEQQRLLKRKLEFDARLGQMANSRVAL